MSGDIQTLGSSSLAATQPAAGVALSKTDSSGTPGNATINTPLGRCAIAAVAASVVITSSIVTATSRVMAIINQAAADTTLTQIVRVSVGAGSFTIFGNVAATANVVVDFVVFP
jgi:hypothetical protein